MGNLTLTIPPHIQEAADYFQEHYGTATHNAGETYLRIALSPAPNANPQQSIKVPKEFRTKDAAGILAFLQDNPGSTTSAINQHVFMWQGKDNLKNHLAELLAAGLIVYECRGEFYHRNRPKYYAVEQGSAE